jgi:hypothetical protein
MLLRAPKQKGESSSDDDYKPKQSYNIESDSDTKLDSESLKFIKGYLLNKKRKRTNSSSGVAKKSNDNQSIMYNVFKKLKDIDTSMNKPKSNMSSLDTKVQAIEIMVTNMEKAVHSSIGELSKTFGDNNSTLDIIRSQNGRIEVCLDALQTLQRDTESIADQLEEINAKLA